MRYKSIVSVRDNAQVAAQVSCALFAIRIIILYAVLYILYSSPAEARILLLLPFNAVLYAV